MPFGSYFTYEFFIVLICFALETLNLCLLLYHGNDIAGTVDVL